MDDDTQNQPTEPARPEPQQQSVPPAAPVADTPRPIPPFQAPPRRRSIVGPLILIALGVGFLLSNLGLVTWNIWELMFRLWPLWLVAAGIDLLFGRSRWGSWVGVGLVLALIGGAGWFAQGAWNPISGEVARAESFSQPLSGARSADVTINSSVGQLFIRESSNSTVLVEGQINSRPGERVTRDYSRSGDTARFDVKSHQQGFVPFFGGDRSGGLWELALSPQVPLNLNIATGVGKAEVDLSHLQVTDLRLQSGVGAANITLPAQGQVRARIDSGVGAITIQLPRGMAARITAENGIGNVSLPTGYAQQGGVWVSPDYASAPNRVELSVHGGVGAIHIEQVN